MKLLLLFALLSVVFAELGFDINQGECASFTVSDFSCLKKNGHTFSIIQAWAGGVGENPNLVRCINNAKSAGLTYVDLYVYLCPECGSTNNPPTNFASTLSKTLKSSNVPFPRYVWLDVELCPPSGCWKSGASTSVNYLHAAVSAFEKEGFSVGIYSSQFEWGACTGGNSGFNSLPVWYAHYDGVAAYNDLPGILFGGWGSSNVVMKQYSGSATVCGLSVDLDYWSHRPTGGAPPPPCPTGTSTIWTVTASAENLRSTASTSGSIVATMANGDTVYGLSSNPATLPSADGYSWLHVQYGSKTGYAATAFLAEEGPCAQSFYCVTANPNLRLRSGPFTTDAVVATMAEGAFVTSLSDTLTTGCGYSWRHVSYDGQLGYAAESYLKSCTPLGEYNTNNYTDPGVCLNPVATASTIASSFILMVIGVFLAFVAF